jgi:hypothetical protein
METEPIGFQVGAMRELFHSSNITVLRLLIGQPSLARNRLSTKIRIHRVGYTLRVYVLSPEISSEARISIGLTKRCVSTSEGRQLVF